MLEYQSKTLEYDNNQQPVRLRVFLGNADGAFVPILLDPDKANLPNAEIYNLAMEKHYQDTFPNRAENEKFNSLGEKIAQYDELIEKSQKAIKDLEAATAEAQAAIIGNEEAINNAVSELTELIMGILEHSSSTIFVEGTE